MKYIRLSALALTGAMTLSLCACSPKEPAATPTPEATVTPGVMESIAPTATPEAQPTESINVVTPPAETDAVVKPLESQAPVQTSAPTAEPTQAPSEAPSEAPDGDLTAADVYAKVSAVAGGNPMSDASFVLEEFYNLSAGDLEDYILAMPDMSTAIEEIFIAKVKSGKMDSVKAACQSRQQGMAEDAAIYPATGGYVANYQLVTNGDWILFCVCENASSAASAFNGCF